MIKNRNEACMILGINPIAGEPEIKKAYKNLVKIYHPDAGITKDDEKYRRVVEAYEYLCSNSFVINQRTTKVFGNTTGSFYKKNENYSDFEKKYQQKKTQNKIDFEERIRKHEERLERERIQYNDAMEKINSIRLAEAIKLMINKPQ